MVCRSGIFLQADVGTGSGGEIALSPIRFPPWERAQRCGDEWAVFGEACAREAAPVSIGERIDR